MRTCLHKLLVVFICLVIASCSGTRCLKQGEVLYVGSTLLVKLKSGEKAKTIKYSGMKLRTAYLSVWDLPNGAVFGLPAVRFIPTRLIVYNWFYNDKEKGFSHWMRNNLGEEPVLISDVQPDLKAQKLVETFEGFGHFGTTATYRLRLNRKKNKAFVTYSMEVPAAFSYRKVDYLLDPNQNKMLSSINEHKKTSTIKPGREYNIDTLKQERLSLYEQLQNDGFCYVHEADVIIEADTSAGNKQVDLRIRINSDLNSIERSIADITKLEVSIDSVSYDDVSSKQFYIYSSGKIKRNFLDSLLYLKAGNRYSLKKARQTNDVLSSLGIFKANFISYQPQNGDSTKLQATVNLIPADASNLSFNIKGSYKTAGYIGPSVGLKLSQLNLFGKAQNLYVDVDYYYDFPIGVFRERISNSSGVSARSILKAPFTNSKIRLSKNPSTLPFQFGSFNVEYNDRKDYFRILSWNASYGISWSKNKQTNNRLDLINLTYSDLLTTTTRFDSLVAENPSLKASLVNQFIFGLAYTYTYDKRSKASIPEGPFFQGHFESAGNAISLINEIVTDDTKGNRTLMDAPIAQFMQLSYDFRYYKKTGRTSSLVFRHIGGFGLPYGNSKQMPYIRQYFIGGTNSLRPLSARTVGPGRYLEFTKGEVNQVGDIKLEMNLEYRFKMGVLLNGAFWSDAGNIWLLNEDPERPGSGIRWGKIVQDSYLTAGAGLRLDLNYLILRVDYGFLLYAPIFIDGKKWLWQNKFPLWGMVIGFGYPF